MAGHQTMSGQDDYLSVQKFGFGGHFDWSCTWFPNDKLEKKLFFISGKFNPLVTDLANIVLNGTMTYLPAKTKEILLCFAI